MQHAFERLTGQKTDRTEARNGLVHVLSLSMSKVADGLIDPKLVLSWLLGALGAPSAIIALLVPIREAGALLPQIFLAGRLQRMTQRRWMWVVGSAGQGVSAAAIVLAALTLQGMLAGLAFCAALGALALSRAACSVSYKDILGKTVGQAKRGAVTGFAGSVSAAAVLVFALMLLTGFLQNEAGVIGAIALAAILWALAALNFMRLSEEDSAKSGPETAEGFRDLLRQDANLRQFILVRGLLTSTALAPPFLAVMTTGQNGSDVRTLGALVLASAAAGFASSYVWGWLADRSSRLMLLLAGGLAAVAMGAAIAVQTAGLAQVPALIPGILFILMVAYHGVRQARSTYLVDISPENRRTANAAVANLAIGLVLLGAGIFGGALSWVGPNGALTGFAAMSLAGGLFALRLEEVGDRAD